MKLLPLFLALLAPLAASADVPTIKPADAARLVAEGKAVLVDIREPAEWLDTGVATPATEKPYRIGLPECGLSICPGWGGTQMLPARIDPAVAIRSTATGETWKSSELPSGLLAATVATPGDLREAALGWLRANPRRGSRSHPTAIDQANAARVRAGLDAARSTIQASTAAAAVIDAVEVGLRDGWTKAVDAERRHLIRLRHTPEARAKLEAFFAKS
mgnify:CR=1 FL=1